MSLVLLNVRKNILAVKNVACHAYSCCSFRVFLERADFLIVLPLLAENIQHCSGLLNFSKYSSLLASYGCDANINK